MDENEEINETKIDETLGLVTDLHQIEVIVPPKEVFCFCLRVQNHTVTDGWETGGRPPAQHQMELKHYMRCKGLCCPLGGTVSDYFYKIGCNRCWCCFDLCFKCTNNYLVDPGVKSDSRYAQIEEWFRSFNCWPMPLVTIVFCTIEIAYYAYLMQLPDVYNNELLRSDLIWKSNVRSDSWRWFTYSFCHGGKMHLTMNVALQFMLGLYVEFEHKWVRTLIIYVLGVATGSLFHSLVNPCMPLCGSSGGVYALMGAGIIKAKRHKKYKGFLRRWCNVGIALIVLLLVCVDLGYSIYNWATCNPETKSTAISAHVGGLFAGLCISYWALNKFQESWGQKIERDTGRSPDIHADDVACCNIRHCSAAWISNPDCQKLVRDPCALMCIAVFVIVWVACIVYNCTISPANNETCSTPGAFNKCYMF